MDSSRHLKQSGSSSWLLMKLFAVFSLAGLSGIAIDANYGINFIDGIGDTVLIVSTAKKANSKGLHIAITDC